VARGVDLDDVQVLALADRDALGAGPAGLGRRALLAVDHLREDPRGRGLAGAARAAEEEGVREPPLPHGPHEGPHDVLLTEHLLRALRPVLAVQGPVLLLGHAPSSMPGAPSSQRQV